MQLFDVECLLFIVCLYALMFIYACDTLTLCCRIFGQFSMEVILATAFGQKIQILRGEATDLTKAAKTVIDGFYEIKRPMFIAFVLGELIYPNLNLSQNYYNFPFILYFLNRPHSNSSTFGSINNYANFNGKGIFIFA